MDEGGWDKRWENRWKSYYKIIWWHHKKSKCYHVKYPETNWRDLSSCIVETDQPDSWCQSVGYKAINVAKRKKPWTQGIALDRYFLK